MYRLRWYCWAILNGGRFGDLRTIYQGCRALPFALAGLSCSVWSCNLFLPYRVMHNLHYTLCLEKRVYSFLCITNKFRCIFVIFDMNNPENSFYLENRTFVPNIITSHADIIVMSYCHLQITDATMFCLITYSTGTVDSFSRHGV